MWRGSVSCRKARSLIKATAPGMRPLISQRLHEFPRRLALRARHWVITAAGEAGGSGLPATEANTRMKSMDTVLAAGYEQAGRALLLQ